MDNEVFSGHESGKKGINPGDGMCDPLEPSYRQESSNARLKGADLQKKGKPKMHFQYVSRVSRILL